MGAKAASAQNLHSSLNPQTPIGKKLKIKKIKFKKDSSANLNKMLGRGLASNEGDMIDTPNQLASCGDNFPPVSGFSIVPTISI